MILVAVPAPYPFAHPSIPVALPSPIAPADRVFVASPQAPAPVAFVNAPFPGPIDFAALPQGPVQIVQQRKCRSIQCPHGL